MPEPDFSLPFQQTATSLNKDGSAFEIDCNGGTAIAGKAALSTTGFLPGAGVYGVYGEIGGPFPNIAGEAGALLEISGSAVGGHTNTGQIGVSGASQSGTGVLGVGNWGGQFFAGTNASNNGNALQVTDPNDEDALVSNSSSAHHAAVSGHNTGGGFAFWGASSSTGGTGIYATGQKQAAQFDGAVQVNGTLNVSDDIVITGADFAEEFDLTGTADAEPGTVMVLDRQGGVEPSCSAYDRRVAGIISGAGEYRPGLILDKRASRRPRKALALVGKVFCKVDANYAPIDIGDLLTTSPTRGHAMKAIDAAQSFGAVIGKALRPISEGEGLIPVLVALQ